MNARGFFRLAALGALLSLLGCGSSSNTLSVPKVSAIVSSALPAGLKPGGSAPVVPSRLRELAQQVVKSAATRTTTATNTNASLASGYITNLFQDSYAASTGSVQGYLMALVTTVDDRMSLFQGAKISGCLAATVAAVPIDLSAIDPVLKVSLNDIQCYAPFGTGTVSTGTADAGEAFGQSGVNTSLWVQASNGVATNGTAGAVWANVKNAGSTSTTAPESVDGVAVVFNPNTSSNTGGVMNLTRFIATPTNKTFELYYGGSQGNIGTASSNDTALVGAGFRMISDGNFIWADGKLCIDPGDTTCNVNANWVAFGACLDIATVAVHSPASDCQTLANSFTLNNVNASLTFTSVTGDSNLGHSYGGSTGPSDANQTLVLPFLSITQFQSTATKYGS